jgi:hypothetical protein
LTASAPRPTRLERPELGDGLALPAESSGVVALALFGRLCGPTYLVEAATGEVRAVPRRALGRGWRSPEELAEVEFGVDGRARLRQGDERLPLDRRVRLACYLDGRAVLTGGAGLREDRRFGVVRGELVRWTGGAGLASVPLDLAPWTIEGEDDAAAIASVQEGRRPHPVTTLVRRGEPQAQVRLEGATVEPTSIEADALLALTDAGLERVALPGGARTLLLPRAEVLLAARRAGGRLRGPRHRDGVVPRRGAGRAAPPDACRRGAYPLRAGGGGGRGGHRRPRRSRSSDADGAERRLLR